MEININKKTIIIAIVVAVAVYLLWKKGLFSKDAPNNASYVDDPSVTDPTSLDYILSHIDFNDTVRDMIKTLLNKTKVDKTYYQKIMAKAKENHYSFDQQLVLDAIWYVYHTDNGWIEVNGSTNYGWRLQQKVLNLA